ncbi:uncharacterized protein [Lepeophtheirus salmonis]|uniref:uncharacterized protein n=1 Tax=Lepeophtheirus salmonis TaxID=72036 RepID=UPI001AE729FB|nr:nucleoplasmin-like protein ANO39 [Lepeophtheirus salmonis]
MLESNSTKTPRSLEDLSSDEEEDAANESPLPTIKSRKKIKIDAQDEKEKSLLKEGKKRPLERKVESEEEELDDVKRYKLSQRDSPPPKDSPKSSKKDIQSSCDTEEEEEDESDDDADDEDDDPKNKSPKRLTLPLISEIVPESPVSDCSPRRKDAQVISIEGLQHDKMKERERVDDLLKDL